MFGPVMTWQLEHSATAQQLPLMTVIPFHLLSYRYHALSTLAVHAHLQHSKGPQFMIHTPVPHIANAAFSFYNTRCERMGL